MADYYLSTPLDDNSVSKLKIGDNVYITGIIYTARDTAHKRLCNIIKNNEEFPLDLKGQIIFYAGPAPAKPGYPIGSVGPTTSYRMDPYAPILMESTGLKGMIGKGKRSQTVIESIRKNNCVYFGAVGGVAALLCRCVKESEVVLYPELGPEAVHKLLVENLPVIVINDSDGKDLYSEEIKKYHDEEDKS